MEDFSNIIEIITEICRCLRVTKIPHVIGGETLAGLTENNLTKYANNITFYIIDVTPAKLFLLSILLLRHRILFKVKIIDGSIVYKLRKKPSVTKKNPEYYLLHPLKTRGDLLQGKIGNREIRFDRSDINAQSVSEVYLDGCTFPVPENPKAFVRKYNQNLFASFYKRYDIYLDGDSEIKAVTLLEKIADVIETEKCEYWLDGGTLLGAVRDGKLIPWDHDLDLGLKYKSDEQIRSLITALKKKFYVRVLPFSRKTHIWQLGKYRVLKVYPRKFRFGRDKLCADIFIFYRGTLDQTREIVYKYGVWDQNAVHNHQVLDTLSTLTFYGREYSVPGQPEKFLQAKYGKDWRTPRKDWHVSLDDKTLTRAS
ncbi:MAG: LicD family protein [FCB group bacterium]|nr:LicD family protein [FCB group bacterium]